MEKRIISDIQTAKPPLAVNSLDLEALAIVEVTSENPNYPIEAALLPGFNHGWQAGEPGTQTIRLLFKQAQKIQCVQLEFFEPILSRTQEYVLRVSQDNGVSYREIVRQQWNFSPDGATAESETHGVELPDVTTIELQITPNISDQLVFATLENMRVFEVFPTSVSN